VSASARWFSPSGMSTARLLRATIALLMLLAELRCTMSRSPRGRAPRSRARRHPGLGRRRLGLERRRLGSGTKASRLGTAASRFGDGGIPVWDGGVPVRGRRPPGLVEGRLGAGWTHPGFGGRRPGAGRRHPGLAGGRPGAGRTHPGLAGGHPGLAGGLPVRDGPIPAWWGTSRSGLGRPDHRGSVAVRGPLLHVSDGDATSRARGAPVRAGGITVRREERPGSGRRHHGPARGTPRFGPAASRSGARNATVRAGGITVRREDAPVHDRDATVPGENATAPGPGIAITRRGVTVTGLGVPALSGAARSGGRGHGRPRRIPVMPPAPRWGAPRPRSGAATPRSSPRPDVSTSRRRGLLRLHHDAAPLDRAAERAPCPHGALVDTSSP
jgi:hypothetical protein